MSYKWYDGQRIVSSIEELKTIPTKTEIKVRHGDGYVSESRNLSNPHAGAIAIVLEQNLSSRVNSGYDEPNSSSLIDT